VVAEASVWIVFGRYSMRMRSLAGPLLAQLATHSVFLVPAVVRSIVYWRAKQLERLSVEKKHRKFENFDRVFIGDTQIGFGRIQLLTARVDRSCTL
jgi:hypothetical protein